MDSICH